MSEIRLYKRKDSNLVDVRIPVYMPRNSNSESNWIDIPVGTISSFQADLICDQKKCSYYTFDTTDDLPTREKYPALAEAWDNYQLIKALTFGGDV